ncbi:ABC transporter permease [Acinetobacter genomosp. 15BJ]|uniref:ABC transporter permease n=1 Tax=Acinetobacter genomosp. 15BJ TaxID=106651 RepID=R9B112_9GAMM|nr:ABC transporter permease [Acinetobacter genomosp. 15BJ]EOR07970.1 NitT/TauT family transport system permease [Acinetobacter genomosp. 15BJ]MCH7291094.1 ABC transporter permease [Acinetobacter genomosp. 15BJ]MDO3656274.1 ABC transporter permease [Acinetobacter genomosp. 15BJ]
MHHSVLSKRKKLYLSLGSFLIPILIWSCVSYLPFIWHPQVQITDAGSATYLQAGTRIDKQAYYAEAQDAVNQGKTPPTGILVNPIYLPAPHQVAKALFTSFTTPPQQADAPWLHQSLWHSIKIVFTAFFISSLIGVPLGILCGFSNTISKLTEPFVEFFRYLPAPAFGALAVAILGINDAPKIAIIVIGTLFQQILIIANTTRMVDRGLVEAGYTLGTNKLKSLFHVVIPAALPDIYRDQRVLLGWAWTYLIVSELIGATSGITWFITQQARYQNFDNVYAAILIIGVIGLLCDLILMKLGTFLFKWKKGV